MLYIIDFSLLVCLLLFYKRHTCILSYKGFIIIFILYLFSFISCTYILGLFFYFSTFCCYSLIYIFFKVLMIFKRPAAKKSHFSNSILGRYAYLHCEGNLFINKDDYVHIAKLIKSERQLKILG